MYAIKALRFSTALSVLKDEFLRSRDYPQCPPTSHLFHRFRQLGYACIKYVKLIKPSFELLRVLTLFSMLWGCSYPDKQFFFSDMRQFLETYLLCKTWKTTFH